MESKWQKSTSRARDTLIPAEQLIFVTNLNLLPNTPVLIILERA